MKKTFKFNAFVFLVEHPIIVIVIMMFGTSIMIIQRSWLLNSYFHDFSTTTQHFTTIQGKNIDVSPKGGFSNNIIKQMQDISYGTSIDYFRIDFGFPYNILGAKYDIPVSAVVGCSGYSFGKNNQYTTLVLKKNLKVSVKQAPELVNWCWKNKLPIFTRKEISDWEYHNVTLPTYQQITDRMSSQTTYQQVMKKAYCDY